MDDPGHCGLVWVPQGRKDVWQLQQGQGRASKVGLEPLGCEQRLRKLGLSSPEQGRLRGSSSQPGSATKEGMENTEPGSSLGAWWETKANGWKGKEGRSARPGGDEMSQAGFSISSTPRAA